MPNYANIREVGYVVVKTDAVLEDNKLNFSLNDVPAGAAIVVVGGSIVSDYSNTTYPTGMTSSPSHGGGWTVSTQIAPSGTHATAWTVYGQDVSAGNYTFEITLNQGVLNTGSNRVTLVAFIIADALTASAISVVKASVSNTGDSLTGLATGTLAQTDNFVIGVVTGALGGTLVNSANSTGWTQYVSQQNGGTKIGTLVSAVKTTETTSRLFEASHDPVGDTRYRQVLLVIVKAKEASTRRYKFQFDSTKLNNTHGAHTVAVWRNSDWGAPEVFTNVTAAANGDVICSPAAAGALLTDTVKCLVEGPTGASVGRRAGVVEDV